MLRLRREENEEMKAELIAEAQEQFDAVDSNRDGLIQVEEAWVDLNRAMNENGSIQKLGRELLQMDENGNGVIEPGEFEHLLR